jgi:hypothetical protein
VSLDQLIAKLEKLSTQVEKGMSRQGFTVWIGMIREDLYKIASVEVRKGALKMLGVIECAGFCLERAPEARETLILPNLMPLIDCLKDSARSKARKVAKAEPAVVRLVEEPVQQSVQEDLSELGFNPS